MDAKTESRTPPMDTLEIWSDVPLKVMRLDSRHYKIVGPKILFDLTPAELADVFSFGGGEDLTDKKKLITKNRGIVMQYENACKLSDAQWLLVDRLNNAKGNVLTTDDACDEKKGEQLWTLNNVPKVPSLRNLASDVTTELQKAGITVSVKYSCNEELNGFTMDIT